MGRIILADDDEIIARMVSDALISAGHAVGWLDNGQSALDVMRRRPPDLAILDCNMPGLSGILLLRELRLSQTLSAVPVLMMTGRQGQKDEDIARFEGANDYIGKPFDMAELVGRAEALMARPRTPIAPLRPA